MRSDRRRNASGHWLEADDADVILLESAAKLAQLDHHLLALRRSQRHHHGATAGELVGKVARQALKRRPHHDAVEWPLTRQAVGSIGLAHEDIIDAQRLE